MSPRRGAFGSAVGCLTATVLLVFVWTIQPASSVFEKAKCQGGVDGKAADKACVVEAYLGSTVSIVCPAGFTAVAPAKALDSKDTNGCQVPMPAAPAKCPDDKVLAYKALGIDFVEVDKGTFIVPFTRSLSFKGVTTVYGRCGKTDDSEALYFGIKYIPRPKFPDSGAISSCNVLEARQGKTCDLSVKMDDVAVFDCPKDSSLEFVPAQKSDRAHVCTTQLEKKDDECANDKTKDISSDGITATFQKKGDKVRALSFKSPSSEGGSGGSDITGYLMCKGSAKVSLFKYSFTREMGGRAPMPKEFSVCDPADGATQVEPCEINLNWKHTVVVNCAGLTEHAPQKLIDMSGGGTYCTESIANGASGKCPDGKEALWRDAGAITTNNGNNLVIAWMIKTPLSKVAYGKCRKDDNELHFKITFQETTTTTTTKAGGGAAYTNNQSVTTAACLGVLGAILLLAGVA